MGETMPRSLRIPTPLWEAAVERARAEGVTVTAVVIAALEAFTRQPPERQ